MAETFWGINKGSKIEIPEIQRDYAQGRRSERVDAIRKGFVSDLLDAINSGKSLNLDFVFGQSVDRTNQANFNKNKQNLEQMLQVLKQYSQVTGVNFESKVAPKPLTSSQDKLLVPFDGQQRLTTLFLLHLYIGVMAKKDIAILTNFNYKTRESSSLFIKEVLKNSNVILQFSPDEKDEIQLLSEAIKNQFWFFSSWKKDPTVAGMLVMLDEIRKQSIEKRIDVENAWCNLVEKNCVSFDYFDIQEEGFDEDLYVKMNARGKGLTDFENFRAWLEKKHKNTFANQNWITKIDKDWLDLFWKTKNKVKDVDTNFLSFFKNIALLTKLRKVNADSDANFWVEKKLIELLNPKKYTPTSEYEKEDVFNETSLNYIFKILDVLVSDKDEKLNNAINEVWTETFNGKTKKTFTQLLLTGLNELNLSHKTFFFSILKYIDLNEKIDINNYTKQDWENFKDWLHVSRNLIYNSRIDDATAYVPAIIAINNLDKVIVLDIKNALFKISNDEEKSKWISFFNKLQQKEECEKITLLSNTNSVKWTELINEAENHFYFYGQIGFILKLSNNNVIEFEKYMKKLSSLFNETNFYSKKFILQCLFFAFDESGTWLKKESGFRFKFYNSSSGTSRDRDENWRHLFNDTEKREVLKSLLDSNECTFSSINLYLDQQKNIIKDWRILILEKPEVLKHCAHSIFKMEHEFNIRLLTKTLASSIQRELRSYYFYLRQDKENVKPFKKLYYYPVAKQNEIPTAYYDDWSYKGVSYFMDCYYEENGYTLKFSRRKEGEIDKKIKSVLINNCNFQENGNKLILDKMAYNQLTINLKSILVSLLNIQSN